jgi:hypothetical protein
VQTFEPEEVASIAAGAGVSEEDGPESKDIDFPIC